MTKTIIRALSWAAVLTVAGIVLGSCTTVEGQAVTAGVREIGKAEAAAALEGVDWYRCRASPIGAVIDRYGMNEADWAAYGRSCRGAWRADGPPAPLAPKP